MSVGPWYNLLVDCLLALGLIFVAGQLWSLGTWGRVLGVWLWLLVAWYVVNIPRFHVPHLRLWWQSRKLGGGCPLHPEDPTEFCPICRKIRG